MSLILTILIQSSILLVVALIAMRFTKLAVAKSVIGRAALLGVIALLVAGPFLAGKVRPVVAIPNLPSKPADPESIFLSPKATPFAATVSPQTLPSTVPQRVADRKILKPTEGVLQNEPKPSTFRLDASWVWGCGAAISLMAILWGHIGLVRLRRRATTAPSGPASAILQDLAPRHRPDLRESSEVNSPLLCGLRHPTILLPRGLEDEQTLRPVLAHEMAHYNRRDVPWSYLGRAIQSVLWFQPLLWILRNQLTAASEEICDAEAVSNGCTPAAYANCLVKLAETRNSGHGLSLTAGMASSRSRLSSRVEAILSGSLSLASSLSKRTRMGIGLSAVLAVILGATLVAPAFAQSSGSIQSDVAEVWDATRKTYENLKSIRFTEANEPRRGTLTQFQKVIFVPGRKVSITRYRSHERAAITYISDGEHRFVYDPSDATHYLKTPLGEGSIFDPRPNWQMPFPLCWPLENLYGANVSGKQANFINGTTRIAGDRKIDGVDTVCLETSQPAQGPGSTFRIYIGKRDHLIYATSTSYTSRNQPATFEMFYRDIQINVPTPDSTFTLSLPKGAIEMHEPSVSRPEPAAVAILNQANDASNTLKNVSADFEVLANDGLTKSTWRRTLSFQAPASGKSELVAGKFHISGVSDGNSVLVQNAQDPKRYRLWTAPAGTTTGGDNSVRWDAVTQLLGTGGYPHPSAYAGPTIEQCYCGLPSLGVYNSGPSSSSLSLRKSTVFEGEPVDVIEVRSAEQNQIGADVGNVTTTTLYFSQKDHLPRFYEVRIVGPAKNLLFRRTVVRNVKINEPMSDSLFTVKVPSGTPIGQRNPSARQWYEPNIQTEIGSKVPPLSGTLADGRPFNLASLRGKVVVIYAWTSGVIDGGDGERSLIKLQKALGPKGLQVIGLAVGMNRESTNRNSKARNYPWPSLLDGLSMKTWNLHLLPLELVLDKNGVVQGKDLDPKSREIMVRSLL